MKKFISASLSPNFEKEDVLTALKLIFLPYLFISGGYINRVENWFKYNFSKKYAHTFSTVYEAEYALLKTLQIGEKDEVLINVFNQTGMIDPILSLGAKPVFVDISKNDLSINISDLKRKIRKRTKAVIITHTLGIPSDVSKIKKIIKSKNIFLIEDCSYVIGGVHGRNKRLGEYGDASLFSFEKDKSVTSVTGGVVITNKKKISDGIKKIKDISAYPSFFWVYQKLMYLISVYIVAFAYNFHHLSGRFMFDLFKRINILSLSVLPEEHEPYMKYLKTKKYPNALAMICVLQLARLGRFNKNRIEIYKTYRKELNCLGKRIWLPEVKSNYLCVPVILKNKEKIIQLCRDNYIYLDDLNSTIISGNNLIYKKGACKNAEKILKKIIYLPCCPSMTVNDAVKISRVILSFMLRPNKTVRSTS